ncbi:hypothetical protein EVAR_69543_1 [Eumeta japonica]|uniref:Transposable element P transposase-like RNase H domain-containing protein n=1 Tax=Eumeta variegata TaxID=151549 RepID=A0A4C2A552_EUMVA|nr:hypothetical protein EVAR_69543_1 [Eumeta japonica]
MAIRRRIEWDGQRLHGHVDIGNGLNTDSLAEAKEALVFLVTAINGNWKIPVGYFLVEGITGMQRAERVKQCLKLIHETEFVTNGNSIFYVDLSNSTSHVLVGNTHRLRCWQVGQATRATEPHAALCIKLGFSPQVPPALHEGVGPYIYICKMCDFCDIETMHAKMLSPDAGPILTRVEMPVAMFTSADGVGDIRYRRDEHLRALSDRTSESPVLNSLRH